MKVRIDAGGREVEVECPAENVSVKEVVAEALAAWKATDGAAQPGDGPAFGFSHERRGWQTSPMNLGGYGGAYITEPTAKGGGACRT